MAVEQPNILLITTDQQRYDASGGAGPSFLRTPHYDRLRYEGVEFTSGYTDDPVCVPSRMGIMTGKQVFTHGMSGNGITSKILGREGHTAVVSEGTGIPDDCDRQDALRPGASAARFR